MKLIDNIHDGLRELMHEISVPEDGFDPFLKFKHNFVLLDQDEIVPDIPTLHEIREEVDWEMKRQVLRESLSTLTEREQKVINLRFFEYMTFGAIGKVIGVQRERVRQIEGRALRKLRHPLRAQPLKEAFYPEKIEYELATNSEISGEEKDEDDIFVAEMKRIAEQEKQAEIELPPLCSYSFMDVFGQIKWVVA